jgi:lipopolysaccharide/colanic/teichoic acid biosynthesis glycosyltransferase
VIIGLAQAKPSVNQLRRAFSLLVPFLQFSNNFYTTYQHFFNKILPTVLELFIKDYNPWGAKMDFDTGFMMEYYTALDLLKASDLQTRSRVRVYPAVKRIVEATLALVLLALLAPLFALFMVAIRLDSPGPTFYRQTRIGKNRKPFTFYKFRSMYQNIDRNAHQDFLKAFVNGNVKNGKDGQDVFKPIKADQVTPVGRFLRKTSLDELPQLVNIIRGEMSFIGPRPNVPAEVEEYKEWHLRRLDTLPGITGLAQVNGRSSIPFDSIVQYDIKYVEGESPLMDLKILWKSVPLVLRGKGAK